MSTSAKVYAAAVHGKLRRLYNRDWSPYPPAPPAARLSPSLGIRSAIAQTSPVLSFDADANTDPVDWQAAARSKLIAITGYHVDRAAPAITAVGQTERVADDITKQTFYLRTRPETDLPVSLIYRDGVDQPAPVFIHLAGSTSGVHLGWGDVRVPIDHQRIAIGADMARQAARRGYLAVAIEQIGYGERMERDLPKRSSNRTIDAANHLLLLGRTLMGDGASDVSSTIDWLLSSESPLAVRADQLFLFGHSSGGTLSQFAAALDTRIAATLASGSVGPFRETIAARGAGGGEAIIPGLLKYFDTHDLIALIAPRRFVGLSGRNDHIFPFTGVEKVVSEASRFYERLGAGADIHAVPTDGPHRYYAEQSWQAWQNHIHRF